MKDEGRVAGDGVIGEIIGRKRGRPILHFRAAVRRRATLGRPPIKYSGPAHLSLFLFDQPHFRLLLRGCAGTIRYHFLHTLILSPYPHCFPNTHPQRQVSRVLYISLLLNLPKDSPGQWKSTPHLLPILVDPVSLIRPPPLSISLPTSGRSPIPTPNCINNMLTALYQNRRGLRPLQTMRPFKRSR